MPKNKKEFCANCNNKNEKCKYLETGRKCRKGKSKGKAIGKAIKNKKFVEETKIKSTKNVRYYKEKWIVSDQGEVWKKYPQGLIPVSIHIKQGYEATRIKNNIVYIHRIVMEAFNGKSDLTVDHLNSKRNDNRLCNLEYVTHAENTKRMHENRKKVIGELMENNEFLSKKVEALESAIKQMAVIQYELDKKLGDLEGLE